MMKIALFSDIHANLPALEAFFADVETRKPDAIYCLGDLIGYNIWPNDIIEEVRRRGIATLAGNHDLKTSGYAYELVSPENRLYLDTLPRHIRLEFQLSGKPFNLVMAHGSTRGINEYVLADTDEQYVNDMMIEAQADILFVGHSHKPYHRIINADGRNRHVINIGSVGKPKDGNADGCYVLLTLTSNSSLDDTDSIKVEFIRVPYDVEKAANAIEDSLLSDEFADMLRKAY